MGDSDESWSGGDESNSSEASESSEAETSDTDEDVKYTTYPTRGVRWRIGDLSQSCTIHLHHALRYRWFRETPGMGEDHRSKGKAQVVAARRGSLESVLYVTKN